MTQPNHLLAEEISRNFELYYSALFKYFRYRGAEPDTANDLTAATLERAFLRKELFNPQKASVKTWLFAIAHNVAINHWRDNVHRQTVSIDQLALRSSLNPSPEEMIIDRQNVADLLAALNQLEERDREVIALRFAGRLSNSQISSLLGLTESNVGVIVFRSLKRLKSISVDRVQG